MSTEAVMSIQTHAPPSALAHVLAVDDDPIIREAIADYLSQHEFRVTAVADGGAMQAVLAREVVDLVVLDLKLMAEDGMTLARRLRDQSAIPIVMLTSRREEADRVMELELSADDNPTKPFSLRSARTDLGKPTASGSGILESVHGAFAHGRAHCEW